MDLTALHAELLFLRTFTNSEAMMDPSQKLNHESRVCTTVWWFEKGL